MRDMNDLPDAFALSPVPPPGPDAVAPELFRGIYGMPMFVTIPTSDLDASVDFWTRGLGFFDLFTIPGRMVHLRRWAFQDVLLVAGPTAESAGATTVSFACVLSEVDAIVLAARAVGGATVSDPQDTLWNTRDIEIRTPENARVVITAAKTFDPDSESGRALRAVGIGRPGDNGSDV